MNTETETTIETASPIWRLKKVHDGSIFGPVDEAILKAWAESAQIAPQDFIDQGDDKWKVAPDIPFLEMVWEVPLEGDQKYGPTTVGTLREFLEEGMIQAETEVYQVYTGEFKILADLLGLPTEDNPPADSPPNSSASEPPTEVEVDMTPEESSASGRLVVERAKEQHIRQLEEDLRTMRKQQEALATKYRKLNQENIDLRSKISSLTP